MERVEQVRQLPCIYQISINESHIDVMNHLNVRHYVGIFDDAVFQLFTSFGMDHDYYDNSDNGSFALEMHIRYLAEVRLGEQVSIYSRVLNRTAKRIHFINYMVNDDRNNIAATMENVGSHANTAVRRTSPFPPHIASNIDAVWQRHSDLPWQSTVCGVINA